MTGEDVAGRGVGDPTGTGVLGDVAALRRWPRLATDALAAASAAIDAVNVFPVADSDTGTNALLTVRAGAEAVDALPADAPADAVLGAFARGALLGARGNSGVILSRYLGGLRGTSLASALSAASDAARDAVHDPQDGTVLTLAARVAQAAAAHPGPDPAVLTGAVGAGRAALARISADHPVLRSAHVPDAGACALLVLLDALAVAADGGAGPVDVGWLPSDEGASPGGQGAEGVFEVMAVLAVRTDGVPVAAVRAALAEVGQEVVVAEDTGPDGVRQVHLHTSDPGRAVQVVRGLGDGAPVTVRLVRPVEPGVVACTTAVGAVRELAEHGAVVLVEAARDDARGDARATDPALAAVAVARAVRDAAGPHGGEVVLLPGATDLLAVAEPGPGVRVVRAPADDAAVLAAVRRLSATREPAQTRDAVGPGRRATTHEGTGGRPA